MAATLFVMASLGNTDLDIFPICLGGNVFGWTADRDESFAVLDGYVAAGGNFIDTADVYSAFAEGNVGGESETVLGEWIRARGNRDQIIIATKVGMWQQRPGLSAENIRAAVDDSLRRLGIDHIDLYYAHIDDAETPLAETLATFDDLIQAGKIRHVGASNYSAPRLAEACETARKSGLTGFEVFQTHYNLVERDQFEGELAELVGTEKLPVLPYFALAKGFLTGKYRPGDDSSDSPRAERARAYLHERGVKVLAALDEIATLRSVPVPSVALAWLLAQPLVAAPIASARNPEQLGAILPAAQISLTDSELERLDTASS